MTEKSDRSALTDLQYLDLPLVLHFVRHMAITLLLQTATSIRSNLAKGRIADLWLQMESSDLDPMQILKTVHMCVCVCVCVIVHNCRAQYSTAQFRLFSLLTPDNHHSSDAVY